MLKSIGCKILDKLYFRINDELSKIGKTKSDFLRELIYDYIDKHWSDDKDLDNQSETPVNRCSDKDEYQVTKKEVDGFLEGLK